MENFKRYCGAPAEAGRTEISMSDPAHAILFIGHATNAFGKSKRRCAIREFSIRDIPFQTVREFSFRA